MPVLEGYWQASIRARLKSKVPAHHYCSQSVFILTGRQKNLATATARQKCRWNRDKEIPVRAQQNSPDGFNVGREEYPPRGLIGSCTRHGWPALGLEAGSVKC